MRNLPKGAKEITNSTSSYYALKEITDPAQAGTLKPWSPHVLLLLKKYGIEPRLNHKIIEKTLSFPKDQQILKMSLGIRYERPGSKENVEDLFIFEQGKNLIACYKGSQEKILSEYIGTHHHQKSEP